jgi:hypothetical protein
VFYFLKYKPQKNTKKKMEEVGLYMIFEQGFAHPCDADLPTIIRGIFTLTESQAMEKAQQMVNRDGFNEWVEIEKEYPCKLCDVKRMEDHMVHRLEHVQELHIVKIEPERNISVDLDSNSTYVFAKICIDETAQNHIYYKLYEKIMRAL